MIFTIMEDHDNGLAFGRRNVSLIDVTRFLDRLDCCYLPNPNFSQLETDQSITFWVWRYTLVYLKNGATIYKGPQFKVIRYEYGRDNNYCNGPTGEIMHITTPEQARPRLRYYDTGVIYVSNIVLNVYVVP